MSDLTDERLLEGLRAAHPGWRPWSSDGGAWYAVRVDVTLSDAALQRGCAMTVCGDRLTDLADRLAEQAAYDHQVAVAARGGLT